MNTLADELALLSAREMVVALGAERAPAPVRWALTAPLLAASRPLGRALAEFDAAIPTLGLPNAAARMLGRLGVNLQVGGPVPALSRGPGLVLANHPGAYDALALMSAIQREDLMILAADRRFLRALPGLSRHLLPVGEGKAQRARALKCALSWLRKGGMLLHFPAGEIEPDADFEPERARLLKPWQPGVCTLVRACVRSHGRIVLAGVRGVHSRRAKSWFINRWAERRGVTTLSVLLQIVGRLNDVTTRVRCREAERVPDLDALGTDQQELSLREQLREAILQA